MPGFTWLLLSFMTVSQLAAQESLAGLWQRLRDTNDAAAVRQIAGEQRAGVAQAFALLRVYQLTGDRQAGGAAEHVLHNALEQNPQDAWLQFGYGETLALNSSRRFPLRAAKYLIEALRLDSLHASAAAALARLALASREAELLAEARRAGDRIVRSQPDPELLNLLAEIARERRDATAAVERAADALVANAGSARARYNLALAQMANPVTRNEGYRNYLAAADTRNPEVLRLIQSDLRLTSREDDVPNLADSSIQPSAALEKFWDVRALRDGRTRAERTAEHYRRIAYAREKFFAKNGTTLEPDALDWGRDPGLGYDDRGRVYIRYGEPTTILRATDGRGFADRTPPGWSNSPAKGGIASNTNASPSKYFETWVYDLPGRERIIFHFQLPMQAGRGYVLSLIPGCGVWLANHYQLNGEYQLLATKCATGSAPAWSVEATLRDMNEIYKEQADLALASDAYGPTYRRDLGVDADVFAFRSADGDREYTLAVAVPTRSARRTSDGSYRFGLRLIVADTVFGVSQQLDSALVYHTDRPLGDSEYLRTTTSFRLPKVHAPFFRLSITDPADSTRGSAFGASLPTFLPKGFDLSDIVLADTATGGNFRRGDVALQVIPSRVFAQAKFRVFYEIYELAPGSEYRTTLRIEPKESGVVAALRKLTGQSAISLSFQGTKSEREAWRQQEVRIIDTALAPGMYQLTVSVEDLRTHMIGTKTREFRVVSR